MLEPIWPSTVFDSSCIHCTRLADFLGECRQTHSGYHARPVPPFGLEQADLLIVGLAPGYHGANRTGRPFTGDYCGDLLYSTLHRFGFATASISNAANDSLRLINCRVTNAVKCVPPKNKPLPKEINTCNQFLKSELLNFTPHIIVSLGVVAHQAVLLACGLKKTQIAFSHGSLHHIDLNNKKIYLLNSYHVSRYNTQTGRLTPDMFATIIERASHLLT